jgi:hypothetical protein
MTKINVSLTLVRPELHPQRTTILARVSGGAMIKGSGKGAGQLQHVHGCSLSQKSSFRAS